MPQAKKLRIQSFDFRNDARGFYHLRISEATNFSYEDLRQIKKHVEQVHGSERKPFLIELTYGSTVSDEVQKYLAEPDMRYSMADAILISTFAHRVISKFYLRHYKPALPTRVFSDVFEALEWMEKQKAIVEKKI